MSGLRIIAESKTAEEAIRAAVGRLPDDYREFCEQRLAFVQVSQTPEAANLFGLQVELPGRAALCGLVIITCPADAVDVAAVLQKAVAMRFVLAPPPDDRFGPVAEVKARNKLREWGILPQPKPAAQIA